MNETGYKPDLCSRCKNVKAVKEVYKLDPDNAYGVQGKCDRCSKWFTDLWSMIEKSVLDKLADL